MTAYPLLDTIQSPADLRRLDRKQLPQLAEDLRAFLVESVSKTGERPDTAAMITESADGMAIM